MAKKPTVDTEAALREIMKRDDRFPMGAYHFVREALDYTNAMKERTGHVSGQELLEGIRIFAVEQFGPLSLSVFHNWNVRRTEDFGEIVFNMVESGILGKTDKDSKEDFAAGYDFEETFGRGLPPDQDLSL